MKRTPLFPVIAFISAVLALQTFAQSRGPWRDAVNVGLPTPAFQAPWLAFNTALSATAGSPIALATGDVDRDGDLDVMAARANGEGGFVLLRNDGAGRFDAPVSYPGTGSSSGIVLVDLNGDGNLDVAVTDSDALTTGNTVSIYLGDGAGAFGTRQATSVGSGTVVPIGIAAADFDSDGDIDLAVAAYGFNTAGSTVILLRNTGNGSFAAPVSFPVASGPYDLVAGDLTGDGRPDLVVAYESYTLSVLVNDGAGGFGPAVSYSNLGVNYAGPKFPSVSWPTSTATAIAMSSTATRARGTAPPAISSNCAITGQAHSRARPIFPWLITAQARLISQRPSSMAMALQIFSPLATMAARLMASM